MSSEPIVPFLWFLHGCSSANGKLLCGSDPSSLLSNLFLFPSYLLVLTHSSFITLFSSWLIYPFFFPLDHELFTTNISTLFTWCSPPEGQFIVMYFYESWCRSHLKTDLHPSLGKLAILIAQRNIKLCDESYWVLKRQKEWGHFNFFHLLWA